MKKEIREKLTKAKSAEELIALAKKDDVELTAEQAGEIFEQLHSLPDDELDSVAGGYYVPTCPKCGAGYPETVSRNAWGMELVKCTKCGNKWYL